MIKFGTMFRMGRDEIGYLTLKAQVAYCPWNKFRNRNRGPEKVVPGKH